MGCSLFLAWRVTSGCGRSSERRYTQRRSKAQQWAARALYEDLNWARGDRENRIQEQFGLFADRVSTETMRANQLRLYLSAIANVLVSGLRRLGWIATELAQAPVSAIRTRLLKICCLLTILERPKSLSAPLR